MDNYLQTPMFFSFILVEPATPGNVGSAARAIKTMGFHSLRLVNPCDHLSKEARKLAYASHDILEAALLYSGLKEAIDDLDLIIATTAKNRTVWNDYFTPRDCIGILKEKGDAIQQIGVVFGREESGLNTEELELCDIRSSIPLVSNYPSINLAQSVMVYAYEFSALQHIRDTDSGNSINKIEQKVLKQKAIELLDRLEISRNPNLSRRMIERLMLAGEDDIHLFLSFHRFMSRYLDKTEQSEQ